MTMFTRMWAWLVMRGILLKVACQKKPGTLEVSYLYREREERKGRRSTCLTFALLVQLSEFTNLRYSNSNVFIYQFLLQLTITMAFMSARNRLSLSGSSSLYAIYDHDDRPVVRISIYTAV